MKLCIIRDCEFEPTADGTGTCEVHAPLIARASKLCIIRDCEFEPTADGTGTCEVHAPLIAKVSDPVVIKEQQPWEKHGPDHDTARDQGATKHLIWAGLILVLIVVGWIATLAGGGN